MKTGKCHFVHYNGGYLKMCKNARVGSLWGRGSRFFIYNFLQFAIHGKNNSKTKVEKVFFFIFMSSYAK
jgi:hypothetical protein